MKQFFKFQNLALIACVGLLSYSVGRLVHLDQKIDELARPAKLFSVGNIISTFPNDPKWDVKLSDELDTFFYVISQQQFNWLGRGAQAVVFESQDGRYVLKLFQLGRLRSAHEVKPFWKRVFSKEDESKRQERINHKEEIFSSSKLCFEEVPEETGIVYIHLNRTKNKIKGVKLVDRYGQSHRIRGDDACFVLQKKAVYLTPTFTKLMDEGAVDEAQERVDQVLDLLLTMAQKGFTDNDDALIRNNNLGFTKDRAVYIDTGHLSKNPELNVLNRMKYEFDVRLYPLEMWLNQTYPDLADYYRTRKAEILASLS